MTATTGPAHYADQQAWKDLQEFLPTRLRLNAQTAPTEEFWNWRGHDIHLDRYRNPDAPARVILLHGVGTNGRQMSLILGAPLARHGFDVVAVDNLGFGLTRVRDGYAPSYGDWVDLATDVLAAEQARDPKPTFLFGLSAGGLLTYHVAARAPRGSVRGIIGTTFLDQRVQSVADTTAHDIVTARLGPPAMALAAKTPLRGLRYSMRLAAKMSALVNDRDALAIFLKDKTSAGNAMPLRFLADYMTFVPDVEPADFDACPVLHIQPAADRWSPRELSAPVLSRITRVPVREVALDRAGHYPLEDPGLQQLEDSVVAFITGTLP